MDPPVTAGAGALLPHVRIGYACAPGTDTALRAAARATAGTNRGASTLGDVSHWVHDVRPHHYRQARRHLATSCTADAQTSRMPRGVFFCGQPRQREDSHPAAAPEPREETDQGHDGRRVPCLRHHAARRRPAGRAEPHRRRQAGDRPAAGRVRRRLHRGRLARGHPQGHRVLPPGPDRSRSPARAARRVRRDPPARRAGGRRPSGRRPARVRGAGRDSGGQESRPACPAGAADHAGREPGDDPRHRQSSARRGPAGVPRCGALLRRVPVRPRLCAGGGPGGRRGRGGRGRPVRHQRGHAPR